jgi:hypothetical protein
MNLTHAVVWIDHDEAHVIHFTADAADELTVRSKHRKGHLHHKAGQVGAGREPQDRAFYEEVSKALAGVGRLLIVGPAGAKRELEAHMKAHAKDLAAHIVGVEAADHPSDGQVLKMARKFFRAADRMMS